MECEAQPEGSHPSELAAIVFSSSSTQACCWCCCAYRILSSHCLTSAWFSKFEVKPDVALKGEEVAGIAVPSLKKLL